MNDKEEFSTQRDALFIFIFFSAFLLLLPISGFNFQNFSFSSRDSPAAKTSPSLDLQRLHVLPFQSPSHIPTA